MSRWSALLRPVLVFLVYLAGYMALDFATEGIKGSLDVSLWFPPVGLTFALLLVFGWRYAPAVAVVLLLHLILFRGGQDYPLTLLVGLPIVYAVLYAGAAVLLERGLKIDPRLTSVRDVVWFVAVACFLAPLLIAAVVVWGFVWGGDVPPGAFWDNLLGFWAGNATGIAVLTSFLLVASRSFDSLWVRWSPGPTRETTASFQWPARRELPQVILQVVALTIALAAAYGGARGASLDYVYLAFAPVIWVALRGGFERVTVALLAVNVGVVILVGATVEDADPVFLQFGLMALTLVGLLFGALASDREKAQETLEESEERYRRLVESLPEAVLVHKDGAFVFANPAGARLLGAAEPEDLIGKPWIDYVHPDDRELTKARVTRTREKGERVEPLEMRFLRLDGTAVEVEALAMPTTYRGEPATLSVSREITERKRAEKALAESEARFRTIFEQGAMGISIASRDKVLLATNPAYQAMLGYSEEELYGKPIAEVSHPDDVPMYVELSEEVLAGKKDRYQREKRYIRKDGRVVWARPTVSAIRNNDGEPLFIVNMVEDITERKEAEDRLRKSEASLAEAQRVAHLGSWEWDVANDEEWWSDEVYRIYGFAPGEVVPTFGKLMELVHPDDRELVGRSIEGAFYEDEPYSFDHRIVRPDGAERIVHRRAEVYFDDEGKPTRMIGTVHDVTERKEAEEALKESEQRFRSVVQNSSEIVKIVETDGTLRYASPAFERILGYDPEEAVGMNVLDHVHPDDLPQVLEETKRASNEPEGGRSVSEYRFRHSDGSWRHVESVGTYLLDDPAVGGVIVNVRDVTERKEAEETLERVSRQNELILNSAGEGICGLSTQGDIAFINPAASRMLGYEPDELVGRPLHETVHYSYPDGTHYPSENCPIYAAFKDGEVHRSSDEVFWRKDGTAVPVEYTSTPIRENDDLVGAVVAFRDVTERKVLEQQLEYQAFHDSLTGLPNRALLLDRLKQTLARAERRAGGRGVALLFVDLDGFKAVNDSLGHEAGDALLVEAARRLQRLARSEDTVARLGGDEFCVLLGDADAEEAARVAERVLSGLGDSPFFLDEAENGRRRRVFVTASIGVALSRPHHRSSDFLKEADLAMYEVKKEGKGRHAFFEPRLLEEARERASLEEDLRRAIEREEFEVYYQPQVCLRTGRILWMEALLRWEHPERGLLLPKEFVPLAEETGLIVPIGRWVSEEALRQGRRWREERDQLPRRGWEDRPPPPSVCVNLSARQLSEDGFVEEVRGLLARTETDPRSFGLEVTESVLMEDKRALSALEELKGMGITISIDDFGTGYSSLSYLKEFPADHVKIDCSFVEGLGEGPEKAAMVSGIVTLAHATGNKVVAECVEGARQLVLLKEMGCEMGQGHYFSEALPAEAAARLAESYHPGALLPDRPEDSGLG